jgi:hypothetical protein
MMAHGGAEKKRYRAEMQLKHAGGGYPVKPPDHDTFGVGKHGHPVPMKATPITESNPGLGATTIAHPFKHGKTKI